MPIDEAMREAFITFTNESRDLLSDLEEGILGLEDNQGDSDTVNAIFRAAHTLKGSAGLFGLDRLVRFTHVVETALDGVRAGTVDVTQELVSALLPCVDHLAAAVDGLAAGQSEADALDETTGDALLAALQPHLSRTGAGDQPRADGTGAVSGETWERTWQLSLCFGPDSLRNGMDPLAFVRYLSTMGTVLRVETLTDRLPPAREADPHTCYLTFQVHLRTTTSKIELEGVFDFVRDDSQIRIVPADNEIGSYVRLIQSQPPSDRIGNILVHCGVLTEQEAATAAEIQRQRCGNGGSAPAPIGAILVEQGIVPQPLVDAALRKQRRTSEARAGESQTIRVDATRLDTLIDLVGELVLAQASAADRASAGEQAGLLEAQSEVTRLVEEVRHRTLALRMVPIGTTLRRFERIIRDACAELNKEVDLVVTGGDAEMDKAMVERISDPLLHLVRNALDHGIEPCPERVASGKPARGTLRLNAFHEAGCIIIEVIDDGRGLARDRILRKAVEQGLVPPGTNLTDQEIYALIFEAGFSTADAVSNLSGRGVGMDVVRRNVAELRGTIDIESTPGHGSTIRIRLPLTLAIIDGFLVSVGSSAYVIPLDTVTECVELPATARTRNHISLRGQVLPLIRLRSTFGTTEPPPRRQSIVVVEQSGQRAGLVVDTLMGQLQTVIKPLGLLSSHAQCISGTTIRGNGDIALILDVAALLATHGSREPAPAMAAA